MKKEKDLILACGVLLAGTLTEQPGGRPVAGAAIQFFPSDRSDDVVSGFEAAIASQEDGRFQLAVPPGKGYLMILGPTLDFIPKEISGGALFANRRRQGGWRVYSHDIVAYDARPGDAPQEVKAALRRGTTVTGRVVGPSGEKVEDAMILTRQPIDPLNLIWQDHDFPHAHGGRFELHGLDPEKPTTVYILDSERGWGAAAELSARGGEPTIRLKPCGTARMRFVGPDGRPQARLEAWPYLHLIMTPGTLRDGQSTATRTPRPTRRICRTSIPGGGRDRPLHRRIRTADAPRPDPRRAVPGDRLVHGQRPEEGLQLRKDFTVEPGQTLDLGDILVQNPGLASRHPPGRKKTDKPAGFRAVARRGIGCEPSVPRREADDVQGE